MSLFLLYYIKNFFHSLFIVLFACYNKPNLINDSLNEGVHYENQTIIAQVPQKYASEYREKLKDDNFRQEQIKIMSLSQDDRALPEGNLISQKTLSKNDIQQAADRIKVGAFESFMTSMSASAAVEALIRLFDISNPWCLVGAAVGLHLII